MDRLALQHAWALGHRPRLLCFRARPPRRPLPPGLDCLSELWPCRFELKGRTWGSGAQWVAASRARLAGDEEALEQILAADTPGEAAARGRRIYGLDPAVWRSQRRSIVLQGGLARFSQDRILATILRSTQDAVLVAAFPDDPLWGIGLRASDPLASSPGTWPGYNLLGFTLMEVRGALVRGPGRVAQWPTDALAPG